MSPRPMSPAVAVAVAVAVASPARCSAHRNAVSLQSGFSARRYLMEEEEEEEGGLSQTHSTGFQLNRVNLRLLLTQ